MTRVCSPLQPVSRNASGIDLLPPPPNHRTVPTFLTAVVAAITGAVITWLYLLSRQAGQTERLRSREEENNRLTNELVALRTESTRLSTLATELQTKLAAERETQARLSNEFKALSADALKSNSTSFLELAKQSFAQLQQASTGDLDKRQQAIDALVKPLKESLQQVDTKIAAIENARKEAYGTLTEQLRSLNTAQLQLQTEASKLSTALRSTSYAGSWGELQLRRVVEMADMLPYCDFVEQVTPGAGERDRADLVVRLPGGQRIVVDAKAPLEAYRAASGATDAAVIAAALEQHAAKVRGHIDALGAKNYWDQFLPSPEFVVLFLPGDHFLTAALQTDSSLMDRALKKRVLLATPTTLIALLRAAFYGWRQEGISRDAEDVAKLGREMHERVAAVAKNLDELGQRLQQAVEAYNSTVYQTESQVLATGRKFEKLHAGSEKKIIEARLVDEAPKKLTAPEFKP